MNQLTIAIGADHRGFLLKQYIMTLKKIGTYDYIEWQDVGCFSKQRTDYPPFAHLVAQKLEKDVLFGILLCSNGIGMAIVANRYKHVFAGVAWSSIIAKKAREDDHINLLVIPADFITESVDVILDAWLTAKKKPGIYTRRIDLINQLLPVER